MFHPLLKRRPRGAGQKASMQPHRPPAAAPRLTTLAASFGFVVVQLDVTIVNLALPSLAAVAIGWLAYRRLHPTHLESQAEAEGEVDRRPLRLGIPLVLAILVGVTVGPSFGVAPWIVVLVADLILVIGVRTFPWRDVPIGTAVAVGAVAAAVGAFVSPDLLDPLARLIARAAERTQVWLVTHSERLAAALARHGGVEPRTVIRKDGETWIEGLKLIGRFEEED